MGFDWGDFQTAGGKSMRLGIDWYVDPVGHTSTYAALHCDFWTDNNSTYSNDAQTINITMAGVANINFTNNQGPNAGPNGNGQINRGSRVVTVPYDSWSYGNSPGWFAVRAELSGADNGITPSVSINVPIPARPFAPPAAPYWQSATWQSDGAVLVQWTNSPTSGEPYDAVYVDRYTYNYEDWVRVMNGGGSAASLSTGVQANRKYAYRVFAGNSTGYSGPVQTNDVYTSPAAPSNFTRTTAGNTQVLSWANSVGYGEYKIQLWEQVNGGAWTALADQAAGSTGVTLTSRILANKYKYRICSTATNAALSSALVLSDESAGTTSAPAAPTNLAPATDTVISGESPIALTWTYNATDGSEQTQFELQHRVVGSSTWNATSPPVQVSAGKSYALAADTYGPELHIEWQVRTWGVNTSLPSAFTKVQFYTAALIPVKYAMVLNVTTGRVEALSGGGAAGVGDANVFYYEQNYTTPTSSVGYTHGLATKGLKIEFYDMSGNQRFGDVTKTNDTITMTFAYPMTGLMVIYGSIAA
jgi:hypothetical protein